MKSLSNACYAVGAFVGRIWTSLVVGFQISGLLFLLHRSTQARKLLRAELARCPSRPKPECPLERPKVDRTPEAACPDFLVAGNTFLTRYYLRLDFRDEWLEVLRDGSYKVRQLVRYRRGASVLAFSSATHVMAAALIVSLPGPLAMLVLIALPIAAVIVLMLLLCLRRTD